MRIEAKGRVAAFLGYELRWQESRWWKAYGWLAQAFGYPYSCAAATAGVWFDPFTGVYPVAWPSELTKEEEAGAENASLKLALAIREEQVS